MYEFELDENSVIENNEIFNNIFESMLNTFYADYPNLKKEREDFINELAQESEVQKSLLDKYKTIHSDHMKVMLITDDMIKKVGLQQVTSAIPFDKDGSPNPSGIFSTYIFGNTQKERSNNCGYVDLKDKYFHPFVYEILVKLDGNIDRCAKGEGSWEIKDGRLKKKPVSDDDFFESEDTGLKWLIENFSKLKFERNKSRIRGERIDFIENSIKDNSIFISKYIIIPVIYRDIEHSSSRMQMNEINDFYNKLISYSSASGDEIIGSVGNITYYRIQSLLVQLRKFGQDLIAMKNGFFHKAILGKNPDYGSRSVISVPLSNGILRPEDQSINMQHTGVPIAQCCSLGLPFIMKWIMDFIAEEFEYKYGSRYIAEEIDSNGKIKTKFIDLDNPREYFNTEFIEKHISLYTKTYGSRFDPIELPVKGGGEPYVLQAKHFINYATGEPINRPFTWTDLLYIAASEALENKYIYVCRYPITDYLSMFPSKIFIQSTLKTIPVKFRDKIYPNYPVVDLKTSPAKMNMIFNDTVNMSNLYLDTMGADYDGDTVSIKMVYSDEANAEAAKLSKGIANYFRTNGSMVRFVKNEALLTYYNMSVY